jgi:hypothetical protein
MYTTGIWQHWGYIHHLSEKEKVITSSLLIFSGLYIIYLVMSSNIKTKIEAEKKEK